MLCNSDAATVRPVIIRMMSSAHTRVRRAGGRIAAYAGLEAGAQDLMKAACTSNDPFVRAGAASVCAARLAHTGDFSSASEAIRQFVDDEDSGVREAAAEFAAALRGTSLGPFEREVAALIDSPSFPLAVPQLLITLERAPDRVGGLILQCAHRFIESFGPDVSNFASRAAGDARQVGVLLMRAYGQAANPQERAATLDLLDALLLHRAYGVDELVDTIDR
jgi:hypothetical protein